jgi:sulfur carrier protein
MQITLNGELRELASERPTVRDVLALLELPIDARGVAVAVEGAVLPRGRWAQTPLAHGQRVEVLTAAQGG